MLNAITNISVAQLAMENTLLVSPPVLALAILFSLMIDKIFGEPRSVCHPVVWMGHYLQVCGQWIAPNSTLCSAPHSHRYQERPAWNFLTGCVALVLPLTLLGYLAYWIQLYLVNWSWYWQALFLGCVLKPLFSWRMLYQEVEAVEMQLHSSLQAGRDQLARLVSRDVAVLEAHQVRESAIETLAENLNDSVVSPLLWFALLGLPAACIYRFANTADAMWGYRGERHGRIWTWTGKCAARLDDVLSWPGARLTALLLYVVAWRIPDLRLWQAARTTPSPNGGWPMGAMALLLDVRLTKPDVYILHPSGAPVNAFHMQLALQLCRRVIWLIGALAMAVVVYTVYSRINFSLGVSDV